MILQYRGSKNNWCYEEANTIIWANVNVKEAINKYRVGGEKYAQRKFELENNPMNARETSLKFSCDMHNEVNELIKKETNCANDIIYLIGDLIFTEMDNVCVVTLQDKNKLITYVFNSGVYILNNSGGTVQKIA